VNTIDLKRFRVPFRKKRSREETAHVPKHSEKKISQEIRGGKGSGGGSTTILRQEAEESANSMDDFKKTVSHADLMGREDTTTEEGR